MKSITFSGIFFLCSFLFFIINTNAQETEKINIAAGLGHPELLNLGVRFQLEQSQIGLSAGYLPGSDDKAFSIGADYYYHFGGTSEFSARRPWYGRIGLNYYTVENEYEKNQFLLLVPRIGRDFNLSSKMGIALDGGISLALTRNEEELKPRESSDFFDGSGTRSDIVPSLGFSVFYRL